jgi:hypothetical protein
MGQCPVGHARASVALLWVRHPCLSQKHQKWRVALRR